MVEKTDSTEGSLLLFNGQIHTLDEAKPRAEAVLIESERFRRVGSNDELSSADASEKLDLQGLAVFPGFIDSHVHLLSYGLSLREVDLTSASSINDILDMIRSAEPEGRVVRASQLDPESLKEGRYPTRTELDSVFKKRPVFVKRRDEHSSALNSAAFRLLGFSGEMTGVEVDTSTGEPTGVLRQRANQVALEKFHGMIDEDEMEDAYIEGCRSALAKGVTTIHSLIGADESPKRKDWEILREILDDLPVRIVPYFQTRDVEKILRLGLETIGGCILVDGSIGSRTAAFSEDYRDDPGNKGCLYLGDEELSTFFELSEKVSLQIAVHAIGDRAVEQVLNCYEKVLAKSGIKDQRHRIEHAEYVREEQFKRMARLKICLGMQPAFEGFWGQAGGMYERRLGKDRAGRLNSFNTALKHGVCIAGGSDAPITPVDPVYGIHCAVNHPSEESKLSVEKAIRMFIYGGAYIAHMESEIGVIKPGYLADVVGLSADPLSLKPDKIKNIEVILVIQNGEILINKLPSLGQVEARRGAGYV